MIQRLNAYVCRRFLQYTPCSVAFCTSSCQNLPSEDFFKRYNKISGQRKLKHVDKSRIKENVNLNNPALYPQLLNENTRRIIDNHLLDKQSSVERITSPKLSQTIQQQQENLLESSTLTIKLHNVPQNATENDLVHFLHGKLF